MIRIPSIALVLVLSLAARVEAASILPGGNSNKPINIEAVKLDYFDKEQKLVYSGNVLASQGDAKLKATTLTIFLAPRAAGAAGGTGQSTSNQVQKMVAAGPVTILQHDQIGTGDNGLYDKGQNTVILTGNVTLSQGPNVTKGDKLVYDLKTGQAVVSGRVKSMFLPNSNVGSPSDEGQSRKPGRKGSGDGAG